MQNLKNKRKSGLTLLELIVAVGILLVASVAMFNLFHFGLTQSHEAHRRNMAGIEAQLQMERLVGRKWTGGLDPLGSDPNITWYDQPVTTEPERDAFWLNSVPSLSTCSTFHIRFLWQPVPGFIMNRQIDVVVSELGEHSALFIHRNILNITGGLQ
jgi:type II secretory pathway pseudopilin PulG